MAGISVKLPLSRDSQDGLYKLNKSLKETISQNFKTLMLTAPGERIMDPEFGVGLKNYLFENSHQGTYAEISTRIRYQTSKYLPFIEIQDITIKTPQNASEDVALNGLSVSIRYAILPLGITDILNLNEEIR